MVKHEKQHKTAIITGKKQNKKHYDKQGNMITDETLLQDIANGANVIYYHEQKSGEDVTIDTSKRRIMRSRKK